MRFVEVAGTYPSPWVPAICVDSTELSVFSVRREKETWDSLPGQDLRIGLYTAILLK
jgi:hypothetical protein